MRIGLFAVGRLKAGPEKDLAARYLERLAKAGPAIGIELSRVAEVGESRASNAETRKREEAVLLDKALPEGAVLILLDERGKALDSEAFAGLIGQYRDQGKRDLMVAIGGADGLDPALYQKADAVICLGKMTWPHQLVRILIAEPHLAYLVPSVTQTNDGWLMLSAGPITDRIERDGLCLAAGHLDLDCIRGEEEVTNAAHEAKTAAIALAKTWPALVSSWNPPAECQLVPGIEREAEVYQPGRRQGLRCWRTPFDPPEAVVDIAALGPPLPIASMAKPSAVKVRTAKSPAPKPRPKLVAPPAVPLQIGLPPKSAAVAVRVAN